MLDIGRSDIADRPFVAFLAMVVVATAVYATFQFVVDGRVDLVQAGLFAVVFAAVTVTFSYFRARRAS